MRVDIALAKPLHLDQAAPGRAERDPVVALRERRCRRGVRRSRRRIMHVDVDQLRTQRAAERWRQIVYLHLEGCRYSIRTHDDTERLDVERTGVEVVGRWVRVVPGSVIIAGRIGDVEQHGPRCEVEDDGPLHVRGRTGWTDGDDVEHGRATCDRNAQTEAPVRLDGSADGHRLAVVSIRGGYVDGVARD